VGCEGAGSLPGSVVGVEILQGVVFGESFVVWFWPEVVHVCDLGIFWVISIIAHGTGSTSGKKGVMQNLDEAWGVGAPVSGVLLAAAGACAGW